MLKKGILGFAWWALLSLSACAPVEKIDLGPLRVSDGLTVYNLQNPLPTHEEIVRQVSESLSRFSVCSTRAWPSLDWARRQVLFVVDGPTRLQRQAWLWRGEEQGLRAIDPGSLADRQFTGLYSFTEYEGKPVTVIHLPEDLSSNGGFWRHRETVFRLAVHESFHKFEQEAHWPVRVLAARGSLFPAQAAPRIQRSMIYNRLQDALAASSSEIMIERFRQAAYWAQEWKTHFAFETQMDTDRLEGSAFYYEAVAWALSEHGCQASDQEVFDSILGHLGQMNLRADLSGEGYQIGGLAILALRLFEKENWLLRLERGESPLTILFENVDLLEDEENSTVSQIRQIEAQEMNQFTAPLIEPTQRLLESGKFVFLSYAQSTGPSSYPMSIMAVPEKDPTRTLAPMTEALRFSSPSGFIQTEKMTTFVILSPDQVNPCPQADVRILVLDSNWIQSQGEDIQISSRQIQGQFKADWQVDSRGQRWLCFH